MHNTLEHLQNNCPICSIQTNLNANDEAKLNKEAQRIAISIYKNKWNGKIDQKLTKLVAEKLLHFYNQGLADIGTALPEPIAQSLQDNIYHFAGAKNYQQLKTLSQAVYNPQTGTKIPFAQFKEVAKKIDEKYNKIWLKTEQNHAYASTQMAAKWNSFDEAFHLKYKTAGDGRVRPSHAALNNITKPKNDSFWNKYYPPNDYGCRCNVIETNDEKTTDTAHIPENTVPKMFQVNTAKENIVFPLSHPYFKGVPKEIEKSAKFLRTKEQAKTNDRAEKQRIYNLPINEQYKLIKKYNNGGEVKQHRTVNQFHEEYKDNLEAAHILAKEGNKVQLLPTIHAKETQIRNLVFPNLSSPTANPDFKVNASYVDVKSPKVYKQIEHLANKASAQGAIALIKDTHIETSFDKIKHHIEKIFNDKNYSENEVFVISNKTIQKYKRQ